VPNTEEAVQTQARCSARCCVCCACVFWDPVVDVDRALGGSTLCSVQTGFCLFWREKNKKTTSLCTRANILFSGAKSSLLETEEVSRKLRVTPSRAGKPVICSSALGEVSRKFWVRLHGNAGKKSTGFFFWWGGGRRESRPFVRSCVSLTSRF